MNVKKKFLKIISVLISIIIPRTNKIVVFGERSGNRFAEDARYLFLFLSLNSLSDKKSSRNIWLTKNHELCNYLRSKNLHSEISHSFKGLYYGFRAKWHVFNYSKADTSEYSSIGANWLNLWTGIQIKKLKTYVNYNKIYNYLIFSIRKILNKKKLFLYPDKNNFSWITDHYYKEEYKILNYNFTKNILHNGILSKEDKLNYLMDKEINEIDFLNGFKGKKIGYFPTWRDDYKDFFIDLKNINLLNELDKLLEKNHSIIIMKYHATTVENDLDLIKKFKSLKNFRILSYDFDLNTILDKCDLIISDYSGIVSDFLFFNKPLILYIPDLEDYKKKPGLNIDYERFEIGHQVKNFLELKNCINNYFKDEDKFSKSFEEKRKKYFEFFFESKSLGLEKIKKILYSE